MKQSKDRQPCWADVWHSANTQDNQEGDRWSLASVEYLTGYPNSLIFRARRWHCCNTTVDECIVCRLPCASEIMMQRPADEIEENVYS